MLASLNLHRFDCNHQDRDADRVADQQSAIDDGGKLAANDVSRLVRVSNQAGCGSQQRRNLVLIGVKRGFVNFGYVRDVVHNHLLSALSFEAR